MREVMEPVSYESLKVELGGRSQAAGTGGREHGRGESFSAELSRVQKGESPVKLGTVTPSDPTVSHLLVGHSEYRGDCWDIVHSRINEAKPYRHIRPGTAIYIDPESRELLWRPSPGAEPSDSGPVQAACPERPDHSWATFSSTNGPFSIDSGRAAKEDECSGRSPMHLIERSVARASEKYGLPKALIRAVIRAESDFKANAVSAAGACGLMQLMPETGRELGVEDPFDVEQNVDGGSRYLRMMLERFGGDLRLALAAYNAGPEAVKRSGGEIPYRETRFYVDRVLEFYSVSA